MLSCLPGGPLPPSGPRPPLAPRSPLLQPSCTTQYDIHISIASFALLEHKFTIFRLLLEHSDIHFFMELCIYFLKCQIKGYLYGYFLGAQGVPWDPWSRASRRSPRRSSPPPPPARSRLKSKNLIQKTIALFTIMKINMPLH